VPEYKVLTVFIVLNVFVNRLGKVG